MLDVSTRVMTLIWRIGLIRFEHSVAVNMFFLRLNVVEYDLYALFELKSY